MVGARQYRSAPVSRGSLTCGIACGGSQAGCLRYPGIGLIALEAWAACDVRDWPGTRCLAIMGSDETVARQFGDPGWLLVGLRRLFPIIQTGTVTP